MYIYVQEPEWRKNKRAVPGACPNAGHACNCIGACATIYVDKDDTRTDEEIRSQTKMFGQGWSKDTFCIKE